MRFSILRRHLEHTGRFWVRFWSSSTNSSLSGPHYVRQVICDEWVAHTMAIQCTYNVSQWSHFILWEGADLLHFDLKSSLSFCIFNFLDLPDIRTALARSWMAILYLPIAKQQVFSFDVLLFLQESQVPQLCVDSLEGNLALPGYRTVAYLENLKSRSLQCHSIVGSSAGE